MHTLGYHLQKLYQGYGGFEYAVTRCTIILAPLIGLVVDLLFASFFRALCGMGETVNSFILSGLQSLSTASV